MAGEQSGGVLAIGAHAADMELTVGMLLARYAREGHPATLLHLTLGEKGSARHSPGAYAAEKRRSAEAVAQALGCQVRFMPYADGELPDSEDVKLAVCDLIRALRPRVLITHWRGSIHRDHRRAHTITVEARFLAGLVHLERAAPAVWVPHLLFAENWEDMEGFRADLYLDTSETYATWVAAMEHYALWRDPTLGGFRYRDYYTALAQLRGCLARCPRAVALMRPDEDLVARPAALPL